MMMVGDTQIVEYEKLIQGIEDRIKIIHRNKRVRRGKSFDKDGGRATGSMVRNSDLTMEGAAGGGLPWRPSEDITSKFLGNGDLVTATPIEIARLVQPVLIEYVHDYLTSYKSVLKDEISELLSSGSLPKGSDIGCVCRQHDILQRVSNIEQVLVPLTNTVNGHTQRLINDQRDRSSAKKHVTPIKKSSQTKLNAAPINPVRITFEQVSKSSDEEVSRVSKSAASKSEKSVKNNNSVVPIARKSSKKAPKRLGALQRREVEPSISNSRSKSQISRGTLKSKKSARSKLDDEDKTDRSYKSKKSHISDKSKSRSLSSKKPMASRVTRKMRVETEQSTYGDRSNLKPSKTFNSASKENARRLANKSSLYRGGSKNELVPALQVAKKKTRKAANALHQSRETEHIVDKSQVSKASKGSKDPSKNYLSNDLSSKKKVKSQLPAAIGLPKSANTKTKKRVSILKDPLGLSHMSKDSASGLGLQSLAMSAISHNKCLSNLPGQQTPGESFRGTKKK